MKTLDEIKGEMIKRLVYSTNLSHIGAEMEVNFFLSIPISKGEVCPECKGTGEHIKRSPSDFGAVICFTCNGTGTLKDKTLGDLAKEYSDG